VGSNADLVRVFYYGDEIKIVSYFVGTLIIGH
jgi:hypothetical protein